MLLDLDKANREFVEIEVTLSNTAHTLKFFKKNGKQKKEERELLRNEKTRVFEVEELIEKQFFERLNGDKKVIDSIKKYYDENGDVHEFIKACEEALGKQKKTA